MVEALWLEVLDGSAPSLFWELFIAWWGVRVTMTKQTRNPCELLSNLIRISKALLRVDIGVH